MKKRYRFLAVLALAGLVAVPLTACNFGGGNGGNGGGNQGDGSDHKTEATEIGNYSGIASTESIYGMGAVTTTELLAETVTPTAPESGPVTSAPETNPDAGNPGESNPDAGNPDAGNPGESTPGETTPADPDPSQQPDYGLPDVGDNQIGDVQDAAKDFNTYFNMLDSFLDKAATKTVVEKNVSEDPMLAGYELKLTITGKNAAGEDDVHIVYYTEAKGETKTSTHRDDDETETVTVTTYTLDGAVYMGKDEAGNDVYYFMTGTRTERSVTESEDGEEETKEESILKMTAFASELDMGSRVELSNVQTTESETEHNATETETESLYTYSVYKDNKLVESTQVEFETEEEHGGVEAEYTVRFLSGTSRGIYEIERETKGTSTWISVKYNIDGNSGKFVIVENADGTYTYKFSQNSAQDRNFSNFRFDD